MHGTTTAATAARAAAAAQSRVKRMGERGRKACGNLCRPPKLRLHKNLDRQAPPQMASGTRTPTAAAAAIDQSEKNDELVSSRRSKPSSSNFIRGNFLFLFYSFPFFFFDCAHKFVEKGALSIDSQVYFNLVAIGNFFIPLLLSSSIIEGTDRFAFPGPLIAYLVLTRW